MANVAPTAHGDITDAEPLSGNIRLLGQCRHCFQPIIAVPLGSGRIGEWSHWPSGDVLCTLSVSPTQKGSE